MKSKNLIFSGRISSWICVFFGCMLVTCTIQEPLSIKKEKGNITGRVHPGEISVSISAHQGAATIATTRADSSGYYKLADLNIGVYNLQFSAVGYGKYVENDVVVYDGATTALKDVYLQPFPEQILDSQPGSGQINFPLNDPIVIKFTLPMNESSVEEALTISPKVKGTISWNFEGTVLTFLPTPQFTASTDYQIVLSTHAKTKYNEHLAFPFTIFFETAPLKVVRTFPADGATGMSTQTNIMLTFNSLMQKNTAEAAFKIIPETLGSLTWLDSKNLLFTPGALLLPETDYHVEIMTSAEDVDDNQMSEPFILYFSTEKVRVTAHSPQNGATHVSLNSNIMITFNADMNQQSVEAAFSVSPATTGEFQWDNYRCVRMIPENDFLPQTRYQISLNPSSQTLTGKNLPELFQMSFTTAPK